MPIPSIDSIATYNPQKISLKSSTTQAFQFFTYSQDSITSNKKITAVVLTAVGLISIFGFLVYRTRVSKGKDQRDATEKKTNTRTKPPKASIKKDYSSLISDMEKFKRGHPDEKKVDQMLLFLRKNELKIGSQESTSLKRDLQFTTLSYLKLKVRHLPDTKESSFQESHSTWTTNCTQFLRRTKSDTVQNFLTQLNQIKQERACMIAKLSKQFSDSTLLDKQENILYEKLIPLVEKSNTFDGLDILSEAIAQEEKNWKFFDLITIRFALLNLNFLRESLPEEEVKAIDRIMKPHRAVNESYLKYLEGKDVTKPDDEKIEAAGEAIHQIFQNQKKS